MFNISKIINKKDNKNSQDNMVSKKSYYEHMASLGMYNTYLQQPGKPVWSERNYAQFSDEGYVRNVVAARSVQIIARGAASIKWKLYRKQNNRNKEIIKHPVLDLLRKPTPCMSGTTLFENVYSAKLIGGNAYILAVGDNIGATPRELHLLRADKMAVIAGKDCVPQGYRYITGNKYVDYPVNKITGRSRILHLKSYHPLNDWYGLSPIEAASYAIDQHNQAGQWNQALLQNGARPSGALVVNAGRDSGNGLLSEEQYQRLKDQLENVYSGSRNSGKPMLLEGGLEWKEMSMTPKDMDFIETKNSAARDIALAFGVPPQLLGIPGDNKYSNMAEARLSLWEETILPFIENIKEELNNWLIPQFEINDLASNRNLYLDYDTDNISALAPRRESIWNRIENASFLSDDEKREILGY